MRPHSPSNTAARLVRRVNLSPFDVAKRHRRIWLHLDDIARIALAAATPTSIARIQPVHVAPAVPPDTHSKDHTSGHGCAHSLGTAERQVLRASCGLAVVVVEVVERL